MFDGKVKKILGEKVPCDARKMLEDVKSVEGDVTLTMKGQKAKKIQFSYK